MYIGKKVKEIRKSKGMKLSELSEKSGVQIATLSRIEHQKMTGTIESHMAIAKALGVDITQLYNEFVEPTESITTDLKTPDSVTDVFVHNEQSSYEILTSKVLSKKMMPTLLKIEPKSQTNLEQNPTGTEKFVYVLEGFIEVKIGSSSYQLSQNNSLYFDSSNEHLFVNSSEKLAQILCVSSPAAL